MDVEDTGSAENSIVQAARRRRPQNPYPGLRAFESHEARIFFGRDRHIDEILERLAESHFVPVIGPSGCGKSSLIRAGVVPALRAGRFYDAGSRWHIAVMRPENSPIWNLATVLNDLTRKEGDDVDYGQIRLLVSMLLGDDDGIEQFHKESSLGDDENILLVIDQFEELFSQELFNVENESQLAATEALISIILNIHEAKFERIHCIITMRTDNLGDCARFTGLADAINKTLYLTPNLTEDELKEAVELPAIRFNGSLEEGLLKRILEDMKQEIDQLPLMQHIMWRIWTRLESEKSKDSILSHEHYESFGCISDTVNHHARELVDGLDPEQKKLVPMLFRQLTERRVGGVHQDVRRPTLFKDIALISGLESDAEKTVLRSVVDHFRAPLALFLRPQESEHARIEDETNIDIVHECLIRKWDDLKDWVEQEWKSARDLRDLYRQAERFEKILDAEAGTGDDTAPGEQEVSEAGSEEGWASFLRRAIGRKRAYLDKHLTEELSRWKRTEKPNAAWARRYGYTVGRFKRAIAFLEFSKKTHRLHKIVQSTAVAVAVFGMVYVSISSLVGSRTERLVSIHRAANKLGLTAQMLSPNMTRSALKIWSEELNSTDGELELFARNYPELKPWVSAQRALQEENLNLMLIPGRAELHSGVFTRERGVRSLLFGGKPVLGIKNSPDGQKWAVLYQGGLSLIDRRGDRIKGSEWTFDTPPPGPPGQEPVIAFHHGGRHISVLIGNRYFWNIDLEKPDRVAQQILTGDIQFTAVSADGSRLAIARAIGEGGPDVRYHIEIIDLLTTDRVAAFRTADPMGRLTAISYDADDRSLLAMAFARSNLTGGPPSTPLTRWRIPAEGEADLKPTHEIRTPVTGIGRIELSPDGKWISAQTEIIGHLWNFFEISESQGPNWSLFGYSLPIKKLQFLRNGEILTMRVNGETRVWRYDGMLSSRKLVNGPQMPQHVTLDARRGRLSVIEDSGNIMHWNLKNPMNSRAEVVRLDDFAKSATVSEDGSVVVVGYRTGKLELFAPKLGDNGRIALSPYTLTGSQGEVSAKGANAIMSLAVSKDGGTVVALRRNGILVTAIRNSANANIYDVTTRAMEGASQTSRLSVSLSPGGGHLVMLIDGKASDYILGGSAPDAGWRDGVNQARLSYKAPICSFAFSPDGAHISAGTDSGKVLVAPLAGGKMGKSWRAIRSFSNNSVSSVRFGTSGGEPIIAAVLSGRNEKTAQCSKDFRPVRAAGSGTGDHAQNRNVELAVSRLDGTAIPRRSKKMSMETRALKFRDTSFLPNADTIVLTDVNVRGNSAFIRFFDLFPAGETSTEILETLRGQIETQHYIDPRGALTNAESGAKYDEYFPARVGCGKVCWMIAPTGIRDRLLVVAFQNLRPGSSGKPH